MKERVLNGPNKPRKANLSGRRVMLRENFYESFIRCVAAIRFPLLLVAASYLASCGGGGGGGSGGGSIGGSSPAGPTLVSVSPTSMTFAAPTTTPPVPASQIGMATVSGLTSEALFVRIDIDGQV